MFPSQQELVRWDQHKERNHRTHSNDSQDSDSITEKWKVAASAYISSWLAKVERIGNLNYPDKARRRGLTGTVRIDAVLEPDGHVAQIELVESSGSQILDAAARRIIRMAGPYSPFSEALRAQYDRLHIPHHFNFTRTAMTAKQ